MKASVVSARGGCSFVMAQDLPFRAIRVKSSTGSDHRPKYRMFAGQHGGQAIAAQGRKHGMADDKRAEDDGRLLYKSEIFKDGPQRRRQLQQHDRRRAGPRDVRRRHSRQKRPRPGKDLPRAGPRDPRVRRDRRAGGRRRSGRHGCGHRCRRASAPTCCWSSATTTWAGFPPAAS